MTFSPLKTSQSRYCDYPTRNKYKERLGIVKYNVYLVPTNKKQWMDVEREIGSFTDLVKSAEKRLREVGAMEIAQATAPWKARKPSNKQTKACKSWKVAVPQGATAGEVAALLGFKMATATISKWQHSKHQWKK